MAQSSSYSPLVSKIYNSRLILLKILKDKRGFNVDDYEGFSVTEIYTQMKNEQLDMFVKNQETNKKIFVKYHLGSKLKSNGTQIYDYVEDLFDIEEILDEGDELIIVSKDKVNAGLKQIVTQLYINDGKFVNIYYIDDYLVDKINHELVPEHNVLSDDKKKEIMKKYYTTNDTQFPEISRFDPQAQAIGARPNEMIEIIRSSPTAITTKFYRVCI
jgi:DNA-directed RNA polymerase subunit H (RpoH/RPB5)